MEREQLLDRISEIYEKETAPKIEEYLSNHPVNDATWYNIETNDRPIASSFAYMIADRSGIDNPEAVSAINEISYAMGLAQDDIVDEEQERRGKKPAYLKFGEGNVLRGMMNGNAVIMEMFESENLPGELLRQYGRNFQRVYEANEEAEKTSLNTDLEELRRIDTAKASFLNWPVNGLFEGEDRKNLHTYTEAFAAAGQRLNDLQDVYSPYLELDRDKSEENDIVEARVNYVIGLIHRNLDTESQQRFEELYEPGMSQEKIDFVLDSAKEVGLKEKALNEIEEEINTAMEALEKVDGKKHDDALKAYGDLFLESHEGR